jgi:hypothetical protein
MGLGFFFFNSDNSKVSLAGKRLYINVKILDMVVLKMLFKKYINELWTITKVLHAHNKIMCTTLAYVLMVKKHITQVIITLLVGLTKHPQI